ncbi:MAG: hypothetical protein A2219_04410 [Elusimicrobia bacterium RIFOXYA2_FULL_50_26]|nr:MAG: hypothetical protein A2219_04410 [Elusimicrobia bacterium RIFOXYA2_FULL_50_26]OGS24639.1 MAG: hypothetical protein A2314_05815 [Elusimicrobia bacterium RIFOXYB2_FULL_50_12]
MRLSDIFKKSGKPPPVENVVQPGASRNNSAGAPAQAQPPVAAPQISHPASPFSAKTIPAPLSAEQVYTASIIEIKQILSSVQRAAPFDAPLSAVENITNLILSGDRDLLFLADRATPDVYIYGHSVNVCILSVFLASSLKLEREKLLRIGYSAFLHDIGMARFMELAQKNAKFSGAELAQIRKHTHAAQEVLKLLRTLDTGLRNSIATVISQTHERNNGSGYPQGLKGDEIDYAARVIAIADVYEALTHPRSYRTRLIPHEGIKAIIGYADSLFDTNMVKAFVENISLYPPGSYVRLNTDEIARVTGINKGLPTRPEVRVIVDPSGRRTPARAVTNLSVTPMLFVKEPVDETKITFQDKKIGIELKAMRWWVKGL